MWGLELAVKEGQEKDAAHQQQAEQQRQRAERLAEQLRALGVEPEISDRKNSRDVPNRTSLPFKPLQL